jgi:hypothetical protein
MQAKDISDDEVTAAIRKVRGGDEKTLAEFRWASTWDVLAELTQYPPKVVMAKLHSMILRGVIGGHACSMRQPYCRGDFWVKP